MTQSNFVDIRNQIISMMAFNFKIVEVHVSHYLMSYLHDFDMTLSNFVDICSSILYVMEFMIVEEVLSHRLMSYLYVGGEMLIIYINDSSLY